MIPEIGPCVSTPGMVIIIDTKDKVEQARKLIPAAEEFARRIAGRLGVSVRLLIEERDGTFIATTTKELMDTVLGNLGGAALEKTLADSDKYNAVISRCLAVRAGEEFEVQRHDSLHRLP